MRAASPFNNRAQNSNHPYTLVPKSRQRTFRLRPRSGWVGRTAYQAASLSLVFAILCTSTPAAPQITVGLASEWKTTFVFWLSSSGTAAKVTEWVTGNRSTPLVQERQDERDAQVSHLQVYPGDVSSTCRWWRKFLPPITLPEFRAPSINMMGRRSRTRPAS